VRTSPGSCRGSRTPRSHSRFPSWLTSPFSKRGRDRRSSGHYGQGACHGELGRQAQPGGCAAADLGLGRRGAHGALPAGTQLTHIPRLTARRRSSDHRPPSPTPPLRSHGQRPNPAGAAGDPPGSTPTGRPPPQTHDLDPAGHPEGAPECRRHSGPEGEETAAGAQPMSQQERGKGPAGRQEREGWGAADGDTFSSHGGSPAGSAWTACPVRTWLRQRPCRAPAKA
jgi:hypothetical protein